MKIKKRIFSLALAGALTLGLLPAFSSPALAADGDTSYTLTIPSTLTVANSGWNATDGISATGKLATGKKLTVTASSGDEFALVNTENSVQKVNYKLATASTDTKATTSWTFVSLSDTVATKPMGIIVEDYSTAAPGDYADTVIFTASVGDPDKTINIEGVELTYADGDTWEVIITKNSDKIETDGLIVWDKGERGLLLLEGTPVEKGNTIKPSGSYAWSGF